MLAQIDANGCEQLPFVQSATQTYFNYLNGATGYIVLIVGATALILALVSRKQLAKVPGWVSGIVLAALAIAALPAILGAFGINLGCGI